jgi:hypothetical protein
MCIYRKQTVKNRHTWYFSDDSVSSCLVNPSVHSHVSKVTGEAESSSTSLIRHGTYRHGKRTLVENLQRTELIAAVVPKKQRVHPQGASVYSASGFYHSNKCAHWHGTPRGGSGGLEAMHGRSRRLISNIWLELSARRIL